ncbi:AAA family ATPase [Lusitaniella coriacea LEGE 07157]|uniref:AAA family ATPase n=1 Tax=Lusitaniella coriacea LEGE 07157 TaxID=945747 RepID=A0A8J7DZC6_9CYAN|nr:AAA family ATPase [Lusitaniella coriacea]MBE9117243.1 AAA family ATPase [Lusitaniella coriacea LEGE 07157]
MKSEVMEYFRLEQFLDDLGYFETQESQNLREELTKAIHHGRLIALSGEVGCGKTTILQRLQKELRQGQEVLIARSLALEKDRVDLATLISALFYDLAPEKEWKIPTPVEQQKQQLLALIQKHRKPAALFVDDAHDLPPSTLVALKGLIEFVRLNGETLSVVLAGHPQLENALRHPHIKEFGTPTNIFTLNGRGNSQKQYIEWVLTEATCSKSQPTDLLSEEALTLLAERLSTPLQVQYYLTLAFEEAYRVGQKPVTLEIVSAIFKSDNHPFNLVHSLPI